MIKLLIIHLIIISINQDSLLCKAIPLSPNPTKLPALGVVAQLGEFYDARTDRFYPLTMFSTTKLPDTLINIHSNAKTETDFVLSNTMEEKLMKMHVKAEFKLNVLCGLPIEIGGTAGFLYDKKTSYKSAKVSLIHTISTIHESITLSDENLKRLVNMEIIDKIDATHVVTTRQWGGHFMLTAQDTNCSYDNVIDISGKMGAKLSLGFAEIGGSVDGGIKSNVTEQYRHYSFKISGDVVPDIMPTSIKDAFIYASTVSKDMVKNNNGYGKIIEYTLLPINFIRQLWEREIKHDAFIEKINDEIINNCIKMFDGIDTIKLQFHDISADLNQMDSFISSIVLDEFNILVESFTTYSTIQTQELQELLIRIRSGNETVNRLNDYLKNPSHETYSTYAMTKKIDYYLDLLKKLDSVVITDAININKDCVFNKKNRLQYKLYDYDNVNLYILFYSWQYNIKDNKQAINQFRRLIDNNNNNNNKNNAVYCTYNYESMDTEDMSLANVSHNETKPQITYYLKSDIHVKNLMPIEKRYDFLLVCGIYNSRVSYKIDCSKYNVYRNVWQTIGDSMIDIQQDIFKLIAFKNNIYAIGGNKQSHCTNLLQKYDPYLGSPWRAMSYLIIPRCDFDATVFNNNLYVCGGYDPILSETINSCEVYDYDRNKWTVIEKTMTNLPFKMHLLIHMGYMYAIGQQVMDENINIIEKYNHITNEWIIIGNTTTYLSNFVF
ncbi:uncharacterized protein LOC128954457 [Oppia nitens]|uniref:uncharacterized protein LOC128954457 n=1 Tax=Oppia nitens TaxID=1686743 RepID=UPI0023DAFA9D|nr:uncharacterized protein LOC128954457 [Oppia nitens]